MRLIDADALEESIQQYCRGCSNYQGAKCRACNVSDCLDSIDDAPTIDAEPIRHGKWIFRNPAVREPFAMNYDCSECGHKNIRYDFCPYCGAKMDLE